jgi:hypothetical protein
MPEYAPRQATWESGGADLRARLRHWSRSGRSGYLKVSALRFFAPDLSAAFPPAYGVTILAERAYCLRLLLQRATT